MNINSLKNYWLKNFEEKQKTATHLYKSKRYSDL